MLLGKYEMVKACHDYRSHDEIHTLEEIIDQSGLFYVLSTKVL